MAAKTIETIEPEQARRRIASGEAQAVDVRDEEAWKDAHVPGSVRIAPEEIERGADRLESGQGVVVLADEEDAGRRAAEALRERGFEASVLKGGMDAWKSEDFTIQPSDDPDDDAPVDPGA